MQLKTGHIPVGIEHQLYFEELGDAKNPALFFLHGGPGNGCEEKHRNLFDLNKYRVFLFDQRGSNRSSPLGGTNENTTQFLIEDIESLRRRNRVEKLMLVGTSWGAVLALAYAAKYPQNVTRLVLKSPFWATNDDFEWTYSISGIAKKLPQDWTEFSMGFERKQLIEEYFNKVLTSDPKKDYICQWLNWEGAVYFFHRQSERMKFTPEILNPYWIAVAKIQIHYVHNNFFLRPDDLGKWIEKIRTQKIPSLCFQGTIDEMTPPAHLEKIRPGWPELEIKYIENADHKIPDEVFLEI